MAIKDNSTGSTVSSRRLFFGTNVLVMIVLVVFVVAGLNWMGHKHNLRRDMAGGFGGTQLSDRAKRVMEKAGPDLRITTVYTSEEPETDRKKYFSKVEDFTQEITQFNKNIKVQHLYGGNERAELRDRVQTKFGSAAEKYNEVVTLTTTTWGELDSTLAPVREELDGLLQDGWLSGFATMANISAVLRKDAETVDTARREIESLVHGEGLPRYQEANGKIKTTNDEVKKHLEDVQKFMQEILKLMELLSDPNSEFATKTRDKCKEMVALVEELKTTAGDPKDPNVPDDAKPLLQEFAKACNKLAVWVVDEAARVDTFVKGYPAIQGHPKWMVRTQQGPFVSEMPLLAILSETAESASGVGQKLRQILQQDVPKDQLQGLVRQIRDVAQQITEKLTVWSDSILSILDEGDKAKDSKARDFLVRNGTGQLFKGTIDKLQEIANKIDALPALKIDEIATRLQQDNIIVLENEKDVRVVTFDEAWPVADPQAAQFGTSSDEEAGQRRIFDGDSAVSSALLSLQSDKPYATVIFVGYETEPSPQMRQMGRGQKRTGVIPLEQLSTLKEKLEQANFKTKDWNLAAEGEAAKRPEPEPGTEAVYVIVPPAPKQQQNFMGQQMPEKSFGEAELASIKEALATDAKAIFLAVFEPAPGPYAPPTEYEFDKYLTENWGIDVISDYRIIHGVVDKKDPGRYGINLMQWYYMQLNSFTDHPIGEPLRSRRVLMREVCPVVKTDKVPDGVKLTSVIEVPAGSNAYWAEKDLGRIIKAIRSPEGGSFSKSPEAKEAPLAIGIAAQNEKTKSQLVVLGSGMSFRDDYLSQRVMKFEGKQSRLTTDPPPTENIDLFVNSLYWLSGKPEMIAAGPAEVPLVPQIEPSGQRSLWLTTVGWAFGVLVAGGVVMMARRK